jgi:hypothetical protein
MSLHHFSQTARPFEGPIQPGITHPKPTTSTSDTVRRILQISQKPQKEP